MDYLFGPTKAEFYSLIKAERVMRGPLNPIPISRRIELWAGLPSTYTQYLYYT